MAICGRVNRLWVVGISLALRSCFLGQTLSNLQKTHQFSRQDFQVALDRVRSHDWVGHEGDEDIALTLSWRTTK